MIKETFDGYAYVDEDEIQFHFEDYMLKLFFETFNTGDNVEVDKKEGDSEEDEEHYIVVRKRGVLGGGYCLMHTEHPLTRFDTGLFPHTSNHSVDWYIDSFNSQAKYHEMRFSFEELSYFVPSTTKASIDEETVTFDRAAEEIMSFGLELMGVKTDVSFRVSSNATYSTASSVVAKTVSEMIISFKATDDYEFFYALFLLVRDVFSFVCNRRNIKLESAELVGTYEASGKRPTKAWLNVFDKYKEPVEEPKVIAETISYRFFDNHFGEVMQLIAGNYDSDDGTVSVRSIHPSRRLRKLIDLRQCISITSAFEHHVRRYLPTISSDLTIEAYEEIKKLIEDEYISTHTGKKKDTAKQIVKKLTPRISLDEQIRKAIKGFSNWDSLESVIIERFSDWNNLAKVASDWRNELAHEKRKVTPTWDTIRAIRLVEHLNYAIILREAGCSNITIKHIVDKVLVV